MSKRKVIMGQMSLRVDFWLGQSSSIVIATASPHRVRCHAKRAASEPLPCLQLWHTGLPWRWRRDVDRHFPRSENRGRGFATHPLNHPAMCRHFIELARACRQAKFTWRAAMKNLGNINCERMYLGIDVDRTADNSDFRKGIPSGLTSSVCKHQYRDKLLSGK